MAKQFNPDESLHPEELAKHLRKPSGVQGVQVGFMMNEGNRDFCLNSYKVLNAEDGNHVLEIGMGNGAYVKNLITSCQNLVYKGLDYSSTMVEQACQLNKDLIQSGQVAFTEGSIEKIPFPTGTFDCITTTNTLYFWPNPLENAKELLRVLNPGGKLLLAYRNKSCMDQMEVTKYGFEKYESSEVENLLKDAGFKDIHTQIIKEPKLNFDGFELIMEGYYTIGFK